MENTIYDIDYFIKKFEAIPEKNWLSGRYLSDDNTRRCALGHCNEITNACDLNPIYTLESSALRLLVSLHLNAFISNINDGWHEDTYPQDSPKKRVLAALYDIKAKQQPEVKERIVYVTVDQPVRELQKTVMIEN